MNSFIQKNYKTLIKGGLLTIVLAIVFISTGLIIMDAESIANPLFVFINILSFLFYWFISSMLINQFSFYKILGIVGLLITVAVTDSYLDVNENPITLPLLILFWLGVASLILPEFFKKYKIAILSVYGLIITYYVFDFITTPSYGGVHRMNFSIFWLMPIPFFAALWIYEQWRWLKILKADKAKTELALLKSQINPHFFFNTLNNLYGLAVEKSDKAPEMILKLSDMMRYTIYDGKADFVTLAKEVAYLENYIELHKIRYQKKVIIDFKKEMQESCKVAPLLFVILVENAFKHGVEKLTEKAYIHINLTSTSNKISFQISNNYESNSTTSPGIGLDNLKKRLALIYPQKHQLRLEQKANTYSATLEIELT